MEQNGVSIIPPSSITENSVGKSIGITFRSNSTIQSAKRLKSSWSKKLMEENSTTMDKLLLVLGELIGTAILVLVGCGASVGGLGEPPTILRTAFAGGLAIMTAIQCVGHISGAHINPAITVASIIFGNKSIPMAFLYIIAQCLGSVTGYGLLKMITPNGTLHDGNPMSKNFCTTDISDPVGQAHGIAVEALAAGILVFFTYGVWDPRNARNSDSAPLRFGLCVTALSLAFAPYTHCSMNPARSLGPAIWNNHWNNHWIYWVGPIGGSIVASLIYRCLFLPVTKDKEDMQDVGTFNGIET